jgi:hypothetical protein
VQREQSEQLAIIDALTKETLGRVGTAESGEVWKRIQELAKTAANIESRIDSALAGSDEGALDAARFDLVELVRAELLPAIRGGVEDETNRRELVRLFAERSKLLKVQAAAERTIPVEVLGVVLARTVAIIAEEVHERRMLSRIVTRIRMEPAPGLEGVLDVGRTGGDAATSKSRATSASKIHTKAPDKIHAKDADAPDSALSNPRAKSPGKSRATSSDSKAGRE